NLKVSKTTTPQIYHQHLLPASLPYDTYQKLYLEQQRDAYSTVTLANQSLLIGYRSILDSNNQPLATIAIPTFLESPKYDQQLLETTSYLILAYLLVFGLFVLGSVFISQSLTRPLTYIRQALNKISGGDLHTTIRVTSKDEIGNLAKAYNQMVFRLKKLQTELAKAEREAAWKEMAQQVAHEIKYPLTPMKLNVQHLERQLKTDRFEGEKLKKHIQKITANLIEQIQSLSNIASDFSTFSQPVDKDFRAVDLQKVLLSVQQLYQHDKKVDIQLKMPPEPLQIQGISDDLKLVFINIVKNATKRWKPVARFRSCFISNSTMPLLKSRMTERASLRRIEAEFLYLIFLPNQEVRGWGWLSAKRLWNPTAAAFLSSLSKAKAPPL